MKARAIGYCKAVNVASLRTGGCKIIVNFKGGVLILKKLYPDMSAALSVANCRGRLALEMLNEAGEGRHKARFKEAAEIIIKQQSRRINRLKGVIGKSGDITQVSAYVMAVKEWGEVLNGKNN